LLFVRRRIARGFASFLFLCEFLCGELRHDYRPL
jgi:hypothetical protein